MIENEFLYTIAEVGAAYAGFSTLVAAIVGRSSSRITPTRTIAMLSLSLMAVTFSLLPSIPQLYGVSEEFGWRFMCALFGVAWLTYWFLMLRSFSRNSYGVRFSQLSLFNKISTSITHPVSIVGIGTGALGIWGVYVGPLYVTGLMVMLCLSAVLFVQTVISVFEVYVEPK